MHSASRSVPRYQDRGCAQKYRQDRGQRSSSPAYLQAERSAQRPLTPKGVGRYAPLTAAGRGAKLLGRWAGRGVSEALAGVDRGVDKVMDRASTPDLAGRGGWRRPPAADHAPSRSKNGSFVNGRGRLPGDFRCRESEAGADAQAGRGRGAVEIGIGVDGCRCIRGGLDEAVGSNWGSASSCRYVTGTEEKREWDR